MTQENCRYFIYLMFEVLPVLTTHVTRGVWPLKLMNLFPYHVLYMTLNRASLSDMKCVKLITVSLLLTITEKAD